MSTTATLPLPLELIQPVELSSTLEDAIKEAYDIANTKYNDQTQVRENLEGVSQILNSSEHHTNTKCVNNGGFLQVDDVLGDIL